VDNVAQVEFQAGSHAHHSFERGSPQPSFNVTDHLFGETGALSQGVFGHSLALPLFPEQADYLDADRMMRFVGHHATFL
jgi:hypothetical protein